MSPRSRTHSEPVAPELLAALRAQLTEGERLAWAESPEPLAFKRSDGRGKWDRVVILGGGYATLGSTVAALGTGRWWLFALPISLLVLGAVAYLVSRWFEARAQRTLEGTVYGLTTRRALLLQTYPASRMKALPIEAITDLVLTEARGSFADLTLCTADAPAALVFRGLPDAERTRAQLLRVVRDPKAAEQEIAASEAYSMAMHQLARGARGPG
jgi:hypothetical protein